MSLTKRDNVCLNSGALAIGTTTSKVNLAAAIGYIIAGALKAKAITADAWTFGVAGSNTSLAARQVSAFWLLIDAAGTCTVLQSEVKESSASTSATARYVRGMFEVPDIDGKCVVGAVLINSGASAFVPGTTALTSVATYVNFGPDYSTGVAY